MPRPKISLKEVTTDNFRECIRLTVKDEQASWVAPNVESLAAAYVNHHLTPLAIYDGETYARDVGPDDRMVGFVMYQVWDEVGFIMRLMIGADHQGRGYGRAALEEVVRRLRATPQVSFIATSVIPENEVALNLYLSAGFVDSPYPPADPRGERYLALDGPE